MAISIDGLISGLDTTSIITKLIELERRPIDLLELRQDSIDGKLEAWQEVNTKILAFETAAQKINSSREFQAVSASFNNNNSTQSDILTLTANTNVPAGRYSLQVNQLATQHKLISNQSFSSITDTIDFDSVTITSSDGSSQTYTQSSLSDLRDAINSSGQGVTANIINTASSSSPSYRLMLSSKEVGSDESFTMTVDQGTDTFGSPNSDLLTFATLQSAQDATLELDGISVTRTSNTFTDLIEGIQIDITAAGSGTITIGSDTNAVVDNIEEFVDAYNVVMDYIDDQFRYDIDASITKPLFGNGTLLGIQTALKGMVTGVVSGLSTTTDAYATLAQVGIKTDSTNSLAVDRNLLVQALTENADAVKNLFVPVGSGTYTFVSAAGATVAGDYDTQVVDQSGSTVIQMRLQGSAAAWITLEQSGNYWYGPDGGDLEGFGIRAVNPSIGDTGTMRVTVGVAERIAYRTGFITEFSTEGAIFNQRRSLETRKSEFQDQIDDLEERLSIKRETLTSKYVRLEITLSQLKGQSDYLTQQLDNLPGYALASG